MQFPKFQVIKIRDNEYTVTLNGTSILSRPYEQDQVYAAFSGYLEAHLQRAISDGYWSDEFGEKR